MRPDTPVAHAAGMSRFLTIPALALSVATSARKVAGDHRREQPARRARGKKLKKGATVKVYVSKGRR
jgi:hypothetical protein